MKIAAFYGRVSTSHQDNSLDAQTAAARLYASARHLAIDDEHIFTDPDTSGSIPFTDRPGGQLFINTVAIDRRIHGHDCEIHLIITKLDRLCRSVLDFENQIRWFKANAITVHIIDVGGDSLSTSGPIGEFFLRVLCAFAELERHMIRDRASKVQNHLRAQVGPNGERRLLGTIPFGWDLLDQPEATALGKNAPRYIIPNLAEQTWIRSAWTWRQDYGWPLHKIAAEFNRAGVHTKAGGKAWHAGTIKKLLENRYTQELIATHEQQEQAA